jgi:hypothetical protein
MKSYFAKLAARATLANVTTTAAVNSTKLADPFEQTSLPQPPSAAAEVGKSNRSVDETSSFPLSPPIPSSPGSEQVRPRSEGSTTPVPESLHHATTLLPTPPSAFSSAEHTLNSQLDIPRSKATEAGRETKQIEKQTTESGTRSETLPSLTPLVALSPTHSPTTSDESGNATVNKTDDNHAQLAELQREPSMLLRKADLFMEGLFDRRSQSNVNEEIDSSNESRSTLRPNAEPDQIPRLHPIRASERPFEQGSDQPSLVIGKLTVEVVPPAPAPPTPQQQVVVVRGTRGGRSGVPSSRRFGLGQF